MRYLYIIVDKVTKDVVSPIAAIHRHDAAAIRMFDDIAKAPNSAIAARPSDYALVKLGELSEELAITCEEQDGQLGYIKPITVIEGSTWAELRNQQTKEG